MEKNFTKKDLEEAYKEGWRADKSYQSGKESFKKWFETKFKNRIVFKVKDLDNYKPLSIEE